MAAFTQGPMPLKYNPWIKVIPSDPNRLPYVPLQVLYLIAKALPQPSQVYNLARIDKATWNYLQPVLYECEVTYEARLVEHFGDGSRDMYFPRSISIGRIYNSDEDHGHGENDDESKAKYRQRCEHGLAMAICEVCGQRIAIENKCFSIGSTDASVAANWNSKGNRILFDDSPGMTALHWACRQGQKALHIAWKAIEAAKTHQPSYIDGQGLRMRQFGVDRRGRPLFGEIPPPLFTAVAFGNTKLCEVLVEAGCKVNLVQSSEFDFDGSDRISSARPFFRIHESCVIPSNRFRACKWEDNSFWSCQTAGHVALEFGNFDTLGSLLDRGLDPMLGHEPLIHTAAHNCDLPSVKAILDRDPEMVSHRWDGLTPLHSLCRSSRNTSRDTHSLEEVKSVADYLVQKGASLEAEAMIRRQLRVTPLQLAVMPYPDVNLYAPEALIMLGAVWNRSSNSTAAADDTILNYCVRKAALQAKFTVIDTGEAHPPVIYGPAEPCLVFAKLVKAMVRNTPTSMPDPALVQGSEPPMQAFLGAFRTLVIDKERIEGTGLCPFAIEAVGKLLLSTGIAPEHGDIENWRLLIASNAEGQGEVQWDASPWRELISDLPEDVGGE